MSLGGGTLIKKKTTLILMVLLITFLFSWQVFQQEVMRLKNYEQDNIKKVYLIKEDSQTGNLLQKIVVDGYNDKIVMFLNIDIKNEKIAELKIIKEDETPHYGGHIKEDWFEKRFKGKTANLKLEIVKMSAKKPSEVVAVTGATISSNAVVKGVNEALINYQKIKDEIK
jgi:electron transport complex protein RnfG